MVHRRLAAAAAIAVAAGLPIADAFSVTPPVHARLAAPSAIRNVAVSPLAAAAPLRAAIPRSRKPSGVLSLSADATSELTAQVVRLIGCIPSLLALMALNALTKETFARAAIVSVPPPLFGMFAMFAFLLALPERAADKVNEFFKPGVDLLGKFLPLFYTPALVAVPTSAGLLAGADIAKLLTIVTVVVVASYTTTAKVTVFLQSLSKSNTEAPKEGSYGSGFSGLLLGTWGALSAVTAVAALVAPTVAATQFAFMTSVTLLCFIAGIKIGAQLPEVVNKVWHPLMTTFALVNVVFIGYGAATGQTLSALLGSYIAPGKPILAAPGNAIMYFLAPAIWSFAFGLYNRRKTLFPNWLPILGGSFWSALTGILFIAGMERLLQPVESLKLALLPRGTAALAVVQAGCIGATTSLVTAVVVITGIVGANFGQTILNSMKIKSNCARGVSTGGAAMTLGTAALAKDDPNAFPFGALGMALMSTWATVLYSIPIFANTVLDIAGVQQRTGSVVQAKAQDDKKKPAKAGRKVAFVAPAHALGSDIKGLAFASPAGDVGESTGKDKSKDASKARAGEAEAAGEAQPRQDPKAMEMDGAEAETRSFP